MPPTCGAEMDSCITQRCFRPIFRPENIKMATAMVTTPMPPTWISRRITPWPNGDQIQRGVVDHQAGDAGGGGGGEQRVQKGDALPGLGGHRQTQQAGADQNLKEKAQNHHLGRGDAIMFQKKAWRTSELAPRNCTPVWGRPIWLYYSTGQLASH